MSGKFSDRTLFARGLAWWRFPACGALVSVGLALTSCRPTPPLDLRVDAATPQAFNQWLEQTMPRLPPETAREFNGAVMRIGAETPQFRPLRNERELTSHSNPLCRQLDRRTVREVIIAGYEAMNVSLLRSIKLDSDSLVSALNRSEKYTATTAAEERFDRTMASRKADLEARRAQVEANRRRIKELAAPRP